ncbi:MAG: ribbon-helix-helix domain-containing protein [Actinomycetota bacterium]|nr:ribbon-helix-helix domain-containing protein [Actinomycetota bacterium]
MDQKVSVRLPPALSEALQQAARSCGVSPSALVRTALHQFLGPSASTGEPSAAALPDAWEAVLARCPVDVQAQVRQAVDRTGLALDDVLRALLISAASVADTPQQPG